MKYFYSMPNIFVLKRVLVFLFFGNIGLLSVVFSQNNSLFSTSGIGQRQIGDNPLFLGMGNQSVSYVFPNVLNTNNAASYSFLRHQFPVFSLGLSHRSSRLTEGDRSESQALTTFSNMAFGLSFAQRFGISFGLKPLYGTRYSFSDLFSIMGNTVQYRYEGKGLNNKAFVGFSVQIIHLDSLQWAIGSNIGSVFGRTEHLRKSVPLNTLNNAGGVESSVHQIRSFHYDLGTILKWQLPKGNQLHVGFTIEPTQELNTSYNRSLYYASVDVDDPNNWGNPLGELGEKKGKIALAQQYTIGLSYSKDFVTMKKNHESRTSQILVSLGYSQTSWSRYQETYQDTTFTYDFKDVQSLQFGLQYIPETVYIGNALPRLFERMSYRVGFYQHQLPYLYQNNKQYVEWAATMGFSFPLLIERRLDSSVQLSLAYGRRTNSSAGSLQENFMTVGIGLLITPGFSDRWFVKRKLD